MKKKIILHMSLLTMFSIDLSLCHSLPRHTSTNPSVALQTQKNQQDALLGAQGSGQQQPQMQINPQQNQLLTSQQQQGGAIPMQLSPQIQTIPGGMLVAAPQHQLPNSYPYQQVLPSTIQQQNYYPYTGQQQLVNQQERNINPTESELLTTIKKMQQSVEDLHKKIDAQETIKDSNMNKQLKFQQSGWQDKRGNKRGLLNNNENKIKNYSLSDDDEEDDEKANNKKMTKIMRR